MERARTPLLPIGDFRVQAYLDWLCTPQRERNPRKIEEFADEIDVNVSALRAWKKNPEFLREWETRYLDGIGSPERKQGIMDTLLRTATDADDPKHVQAAKTYFEIEGSMKPAKVQVEVSRAAKDLTDEELEALLAEKAATEMRSRQAAS